MLAPELASQIAAGEVVERPASAVKELVENALDAGATRCDVALEGGGLSCLSVTDDGSGMGPDEALLCVERHATSKLRHIEDLIQVRTFGFRGEALPSIAAVSRFGLWSRLRESVEGIELRIEGGVRTHQRPTGCSVGTRIEVRDLFYNVPARRKFLRSSGTEAGHVTDVVEAAALSRSDVTFTLTRDGRVLREWLRASSRAERVSQALEDEELAICAGERGPLHVEAYLSRPERARTGASALRIFVNNRYVKDRMVAVTIAQAYGSVLERGRYPRGVVYLDLAPELVDVNVHPQKTEVRFADPRAVTEAVYAILARNLSSAFSIPKAGRTPDVEPPASAFEQPPAPTPITAREWVNPQETQRSASVEPEVNAPATFVTTRATEAFWPLSDSRAPASGSRPDVVWSKLRFVAQLRQTFLLCEADDGLYVIDQHAAAERVNFGKLREQYRTAAVRQQTLMFPVMLPVSAAESELVEQHATEIAALGLELRVRGSLLLSVHAVPALLPSANPEHLVRDLLAELGKVSGRPFSDAVDLALATMACHGSTRAGDAVPPEAARALLNALDQVDFSGHCPHGRPVVTFVSYAELERRVGRR